MNHGSVSTTTLLLGTLSIAALHALIPSHWLAFAVVGRARRWTVARTLRVTALAGIGHILFTVALGLLVAGAGKALQRAIPPQTEHAATSVLFVLLGLYFILPTLRAGGNACRHKGHADHAHDHAGGQSSFARRMGAEPTTIGALVMGLTLSPCLDLLSVYLGAASQPWPVLAALALIMISVTLLLMLLMVGLTMRGLQRLNLRWLDRYEGRIVGGVLIALGLLLWFL